MKGIEKKILLFFLFIFFAFCALFAAQKISDPDFWWHLKTGEWIWQHKAIPFVDSFSYTFKGTEWINYEWLFHAIIYPIYKLSGFGGLIVFEAIFVLLTFFILFFACREVDGGQRWLTITILFITLFIARGRFAVRPQIISFLFLVLYLYLLILHREERITTRQLILFLIPAHILWVNIHGSFLLGIFLAGAYALGRLVPLALTHRQDLKPVFQDRRLQGLVTLCLLLCLASLVNPYTYRIFHIPLITAESETLKGISEWVPVDIRLLGVLAIDYTMWFRILFLIGVLSFLIWRDNLKRVENVVIFAFFSYMAFKHIRFGADFAIVAAPIIVYNLNHLQLRVRHWRWMRLLPLLIVIASSVNDVRVINQAKRFGFGVLSNFYYPKETVEFLKDHDVRGNIFNDYGFGGYMIWHLWPDIPVFIDGRTPTVYDHDFFWLYGLVYWKRETWEKMVKQYGIEIVLLQADREKNYVPPLYSWLDEDAAWRLVAFDDNSSLYLKRGQRFDGLIGQYGYQYLRPADITMEYAKQKRVDKRYLKELEKELNVACQRSPQDFYPFYYLGIYHQIYGTKEHLQEAEKAFRRAAANRPDFSMAHYELGFTLMKLERYDEAAEKFKQSLKLNHNLPVDVYYYLGSSLFKRGEIDEANKFLKEYKERAGFEARFEAYNLLGKTYLQKHKFRKALSCFEREGYLGDTSWETLLNKGAAYFGLGKLEKARGCFEQALEMNPNSLKVFYNLGVVYEKLGLPEKAKEMYEKASHIRPQTPEEKILIQKAGEKVN